jgi:hypothetical protein
VQEELEITFLDRQEKVASYRSLFINYHKDWVKEQSSTSNSVIKIIGKKILSLTYASS